MAPKPRKAKFVRANFTYVAKEVDELSFEEGDLPGIASLNNKEPEPFLSAYPIAYCTLALAKSEPV